MIADGIGKAVRVRDQVDVRDLIEALVPFAKTINGLSRRVTGFVCGALGTYAMRCLPGGRQLEELHEPAELRQARKGLDEKAFRIDTAVEVDPPFLSPADIPRKFPSPSSSHMPSTQVDTQYLIPHRHSALVFPVLPMPMPVSLPAAAAYPSSLPHRTILLPLL